MSKRANDLHDAAEAPLVKPEPAPPRLHAVPGRVDAADLAVIRRAVVLQLASVADLDADTAESTGHALAEVCRFYLVREREQRSPRP
jgi:non-ribosomal peptide synthetase component F